ncbi:MAG: hypothetical protein R3D51_00140 [Hyphomicrobiaceae bacterium]
MPRPPTHIEKGTNSIDLAYGPERGRFKRTDVNQTGTTTTYYIAGGSFEVSVAQSGLKTQRAYIAGTAVVMRSESAPATWGVSETRYFLKDHLGSLAAELDDQGVIQQSYSFDAPCVRVATRVPRACRHARKAGKRRQVDWTSYTPSNPFNWQLSPRGYTLEVRATLLRRAGRTHMPRAAQSDGKSY